MAGNKNLLPVVLVPSLILGLLLPYGYAPRVHAAQSVNLLQNAGFEEGAMGWAFSGDTGIEQTTPKNGAHLAHLNKGASNVVSQRVTVTETGNYSLTAWVGSAGTGGQMGVRSAAGQVLKSTAIYRMQDYKPYQITDVKLTKGDEIEIYVTGGNNWINLDDFVFYRDDANISSFKLVGQMGESEIDRVENKVVFYMPHGSDVTSLTPEIAVSDGAQITAAPAGKLDFSQPVKYTVQTPDGIVKQWEVTCIMEAKSIAVNSSHRQLNETFNWAKWKAQKYVQTGKRGLINEDERLNSPSSIADYIPSYWAGYAHRTAFYARDFAHQATGAHIIGLQQENFSMLKQFAGSATEEKKWYPSWALNFDGSDFKLDFRSIDSFVREVPAVFEIVQKGYEQYLWTGDEQYIRDPVLWQFYTKAVSDFIELHDTRFPNGIAEGTGKGIFSGSASYNERGDEHLIEAGDGTAAQYLAFLSYAQMLEARGDSAQAAAYFKRAQDLKTHFNTVWGVKEGVPEYIRGYSEDGTALQGFGREASLLMATKLITEPGAKTDAFLDYLDEKYATEKVPNIEALSYLPDTFFLYGRNETAWKWMKHIIDSRPLPHEVASQGSNGDYPEVSYTLISQTVEGLAGIQPNAPKHQVATVPRLPKDIDWLELNYVPLGAHELYVKHEGTTKTTLKHNKGPETLEWEVQFYGRFPLLFVDNRIYLTKQKTLNGKDVSYITVDVPVGKTVTAQAIPQWTVLKLLALLEQYLRSQDVKGPVANQLSNALQQAEHHLSKGAVDQAIHELEKMVRDLQDAKMAPHVSHQAKEGLMAGIAELLKQWRP
ncbi:FIMAH domain-containing protein [Paenibacillus xerothermodurans]|uniref:FIMAH domain-containing protein n=1 Tax=Paenibacillus xerothermodurans TaxID=1977292 RepID=A0A2W1NDC7_PAEXE|nr:hypothetical protein [Paenibacillus xerothermodurans]PZE21620.1 hypothetical protein CBW46_004125 [Paenibacillus xerothermodurans]